MPINTQEETTANWLKEAQKGYIRMGVLILLNKKPAHGYEIMKEIKDRTKGFWTPTAGGVYPILRDLENSGYIRGQWNVQKNRKIKVYSITESGIEILKKAIEKQSEILNNISSLFQDFVRDVLNVESNFSLTPHMPSPFSSFLEEKNSEQSLQDLEQKRKHIQDTMKTLNEQKRLIEGAIAEIKAKKAKAASGPTV